LGATKYLRKQGTRFIDANGCEQLVKIEISSNGRICKAFQLYLDPSDELYKKAEEIYAAAVDSHLLDNTPVQVNQYKR